ncbi:MAG TPA: SMP-30/gluconolactonase/LRE family protein [Ktedonosporobacter sp.]|nr:SMP-30/gluconolactonase/LRE family protein [Ktedonosporobacter sp.]
MHKRPFLILSLIALLLIISACATATPSQGSASPATSPLSVVTPATSQSSNATSAIKATGNFQEYALPQTGSGLMRPAIDRQGRLWFGEMGHNYLAVFDPHTQQFQQMVPPHGASGIMGIVAASDGTIWFAEQYANYIGHYNPTTRHYQIYSLPTLTVPDPANPNHALTLPSAPNDIALDAHGNLWFTEMNADSIGMLNTSTGAFKSYPISAQKSVQTLNPYGIAVDPQGMVWFTESSTAHIGRLDPNTGAIRFFTMPGSTTSLMEIASDTHGAIWATSFNTGLLLKLDPDTETFTPYYAPFSGTTSGGLYGLSVSPNDEVWVTVSAENVIARLDVAANRFIYYHIPTPASLPIGIVMAPDRTVWFTEAGSDKVGMLQP